MALLRLDEEIKPGGRLEGCVGSDERGAEAWSNSAIVVGGGEERVKTKSQKGGIYRTWMVSKFRLLVWVARWMGVPFSGKGIGRKASGLGHVELRIHCPVESWASGLGLRGEILARGMSHGKQQVIGIMEQRRSSLGKRGWVEGETSGKHSICDSRGPWWEGS